MRLAPTDDYLKQSYLSYASINENNAAEVSAQSYLAAGDFQSAARSLSTRNNLDANMLALDILLMEKNHGNVPKELIQYLTLFCVVRQLCQFNVSLSKETVSKCGPNVEFDVLILSFEILLSSVKKVFEIDLLEEYDKISALDKENHSVPEYFKVPEHSAKVPITLFETRMSDFVLNFWNRSKIELEMHVKTITGSTLEKLESFLLASRIPPNNITGKDLLLLCVKLLLLISSKDETSDETESNVLERESESAKMQVSDSSIEVKKLTVLVSEKLKPHVVGADADFDA